MTTQIVTVDLAEELIELLGSPDVAASRMRESVVMDLLRRAEITQGQAAQLLGITRWNLLDLMVPYQIPSGPETPEELYKDLDAAIAYLEQTRTHARH